MNISGINSCKLMRFPDRVAGNRVPITADIFITNYCNNACAYCTYNRWEHEPGAREMSYGDFVRYAERIISLGVKGIILTGGGEPTVNHDFDKITNWLENNGVAYGINTNFNVLKYMKPHFLKISLDGWDEDSYLRFRGVNKYKDVRTNIWKYDQWRRYNSPATVLGVQKVVCSSDEVVRFYEGNADLPFDYMSLRPVESTHGSYYDDDIKSNDVAESMKAIRQIMRTDPRVILHYKWDMVFDSAEDCPAHWCQIAIDEQGNVMYCCHKPNDIVGHIMDDGILEKLATHTLNPTTCDVPCRLSGPNAYMRNVLTNQRDACFV